MRTLNSHVSYLRLSFHLHLIDILHNFSVISDRCDGKFIYLLLSFYILDVVILHSWCCNCHFPDLQMSFYILVIVQSIGPRMKIESSSFYHKSFLFQSWAVKKEIEIQSFPSEHDLYDVGTVSTKQFNAQFFCPKVLPT